MLLLVFGFLFFLTIYQIYVFFLGKYDGLPPLPPELAEATDDDARLPSPPPRRSSAEDALQKAFGKNCKELGRPIKLHWREKGVVLAADQHMLLPNGQLRLKKVSVAIFNKSRIEGKGQEINTIRGEQADIEFDKPIRDIRDATNPNRKPVAGRLDGDVVLTNNRRTPDTTADDIALYTTWLQYREDQHRIWTDAPVRIIDSDPAQHTVDAIGMEVFLIPSEENSQTAGPKKNKPSIGGVKSIELKREIHMVMQLDAKSNFLGGQAKAQEQRPPEEPKKPEPNPSAVAARPKALLFINAHGPFVYEPGTDFDTAEYHEQVNVVRRLDTSGDGTPESPDNLQCDQLDCDKLVLLLNHKKSEDKAAPADENASELELTYAHATGKQVELVSDAQHLHATCNDLQFDKKTNRTILVGDPELIADKDNARIRMRGTLTLQHPAPDSKDKDIQDAHAQGPGEIHMHGGDHQPERIARWRDELHSIKTGNVDRVTFLGQAAFEDPERGKLGADQIIVWLESTESPPAAKSATPPSEPDAAKAPAAVKPNGPNSAPEDRRRPRRLEANGHVSLDSKDLKIPKAERLHINFEDAPPGEADKLTAAPPMGPKPTTAPSAVAGANPAMPQQQGVLPSTDGNKQPIELTARTVDVKALRDGSRNDLKEVHAEGQVHVVQAGATPEDKGVEIKGDALDLFGSPNGHRLKVTRPGDPYAYVQLDKITLIGPEVNIDQPQNQAWVNGVGSMKMPSKTDFQGNPLEKPVDIVVYWNKGMFFDGKFAEYQGGVQAFQGADSHLRSSMLQVVLDRYVSLKERQPNQGEPQAALYRMLCDKDVELEKGIKEGSGPRAKWVEFERVVGQEVLFDNPESELKVSGPGKVWLLKRGSKQDGPLGATTVPGGPKPSPPTKPNPPEKKADVKNDESEMKLTHVEFEGNMVGYKEKGLVIFTGQVKVTHLPSEDPDIKIDPDKLPQDAMWVECDRLKVLNYKVNEQQSVQIFEALQRVRVKGRGYHGQADKLTYEESKDLLTLEASEGNVARLYRQTRPNGPYEPVSAKKIMFWRKENRVEFKDARDIGVKK
jgi:hypothetical protein